MPKLPSKKLISPELKKLISDLRVSPAAKFLKAIRRKTGRKMEAWEIAEQKLKARNKKLFK